MLFNSQHVSMYVNHVNAPPHENYTDSFPLEYKVTKHSAFDSCQIFSTYGKVEEAGQWLVWMT